jgi:Fur family peroxide stress response transcriptional regulator
MILKLLGGTDTHPTAGWIYDKLKKEISNLSLGTVYRNLNILTEQGLIRRFNFGSTFDRYDADMSPHYHFCCEMCGAFVDMNVPVEDGLNREVEQKTGFKINRHRIEFYGLCGRCLKAGKSREHSAHTGQERG